MKNFKRVFCVLFTVMLIAAVFPLTSVFAATGYIANNDFESRAGDVSASVEAAFNNGINSKTWNAMKSSNILSIDENGVNAGWRADGGDSPTSGVFFTKDLGDAENSSVYVQQQGGPRALMQAFSLSPNSGTLVFEMRVKTAPTSNSDRVIGPLYRDNSSSGKNLFDVGLYGDSFRVGTTKVVDGVDSNKWYYFRVVADLATKTSYVYWGKSLNTLSLVYSGINNASYNPETATQQFIFQNPGGSNVAKFDDVKLYTTDSDYLSSIKASNVTISQNSGNITGSYDFEGGTQLGTEWKLYKSPVSSMNTQKTLVASGVYPAPIAYDITAQDAEQSFRLEVTPKTASASGYTAVSNIASLPKNREWVINQNFENYSANAYETYSEANSDAKLWSNLYPTTDFSLANSPPATGSVSWRADGNKADLFYAYDMADAQNESTFLKSIANGQPSTYYNGIALPSQTGTLVHQIRLKTPKAKNSKGVARVIYGNAPNVTRLFIFTLYADRLAWNTSDTVSEDIEPDTWYYIRIESDLSQVANANGKTNYMYFGKNPDNLTLVKIAPSISTAFNPSIGGAANQRLVIQGGIEDLSTGVKNEASIDDIQLYITQREILSDIKADSVALTSSAADGLVHSGDTITGSYTFSGGVESGSTWRLYKSDNVISENGGFAINKEAVASGGKDDIISYTVKESEKYKYFQLEVIPKTASASGYGALSSLLAPPVSMTKAGIYNASGNKLVSAEPGELTGKITLTVNGAQRNILVAAALYNKTTNQIEGITPLFDTPQAGISKSYASALTVPEDGSYTVKFFVWDSDSLKPLFNEAWKVE